MTNANESVGATRVPTWVEELLFARVYQRFTKEPYPEKARLPDWFMQLPESEFKNMCSGYLVTALAEKVDKDSFTQQFWNDARELDDLRMQINRLKNDRPDTRDSALLQEQLLKILELGESAQAIDNELRLLESKKAELFAKVSKAEQKIRVLRLANALEAFNRAIHLKEHGTISQVILNIFANIVLQQLQEIFSEDTSLLVAQIPAATQAAKPTSAAELAAPPQEVKKDPQFPLNAEDIAMLAVMLRTNAGEWSREMLLPSEALWSVPSDLTKEMDAYIANYMDSYTSEEMGVRAANEVDMPAVINSMSHPLMHDFGVWCKREEVVRKLRNFFTVLPQQEIPEKNKRILEYYEQLFSSTALQAGSQMSWYEYVLQQIEQKKNAVKRKIGASQIQ